MFIDEAIGDVLSRLHVLITAAHPSSLDWNPIQVYDFMVSTSDAVYCPFAFGYSNYSRGGEGRAGEFHQCARCETGQGGRHPAWWGRDCGFSMKSSQRDAAVSHMPEWLVNAR